MAIKDYVPLWCDVERTKEMMAYYKIMDGIVNYQLESEIYKKGKTDESTRTTTN